ncbi:hypothetical protein HYX13_05915 [Candidatus Woesearchaeota archaeon]|nr:hypothetical protein [Candidatus Woesearchaeota archaeon]
MDNFTKISLFGVMFLIMLALFGMPEEIHLPGATWNVNNEDKQDSVIKIDSQQIKAKQAITIQGFNSRQQIYDLGDNAYVDFTFLNPAKLDFNFSVDWYHNDDTYYGWTNQSNQYASEFHSWYPVYKIGEWKVRVLWKWSYANVTYTKDAIAKFEVR